MEFRVLRSTGDGPASALTAIPDEAPSGGWVWVDVQAGNDDVERLVELTSGMALDPIAVRDSVRDIDISKVDDFGNHLLIVLHGLRDDRVETFEIDCFLTNDMLITVHHDPSPVLEALWQQLGGSAELARGPVDEVLARLADMLTRRLLRVVDVFDVRIDELIDEALAADPTFLGEMTAVRLDLATVRRVIHPQRETLDVLRSTPSSLVTESGRRRFSDAFDVAARTAQDLDAARSALSETLDAYRGAEARAATNVTKVLTLYAAIILPLSLITGFFGMNFVGLPGLRSDWGWLVVTGVIVAVGAISLGIFISLGWVRRPTGREAGQALGRGLIEAVKAPVQVGEVLYEATTMPLRSLGRGRKVPDDTSSGDS